jgi:hypothetical protein
MQRRSRAPRLPTAAAGDEKKKKKKDDPKTKKTKKKKETLSIDVDNKHTDNQQECDNQSRTKRKKYY